MARVGMNPARGRFTEYRPARVTVAVLVHIPHLAGYFEQRLDVLKVCLGSILENTVGPYDLMVFDNGSCEEVSSYLEDLRRSGEVRYLVHSSANVGKIGAFQVLFRAAPGEVVAYCDDDIYHYPGWLEAHLEILDTYPNVGMVSGCAVRSLFEKERISSNLGFAEREPGVTLKRGRFIPPEWTQDWAESYGRDAAAVERETAGIDDLILEYRGVQAYAMANHNQFVTPKAVITRCLPATWSGRLMGEMRELDIAVNRAGYLRLTTVTRTTQHMGNKVNPRLWQEMGAGLRSAFPAGGTRRRRRSVMSKIARLRPVRWILLGAYRRLFDWLSP